ncbi:collagen alpha-1(X) chain-like [Mercenaria mercenaria]|uniref:collagen alpha-1(X) chain-like n=1 Tax=Mercenaria mercenaria TaxID=6596 RepID=UPI00234F285F|nr:collagen alpha-1(X) chain-like [Mercenaria mercenaria]
MKSLKFIIVLLHACCIHGNIEERLEKLETDMVNLKEHVHHQDVLINHLNNVILSQNEQNGGNGTTRGRRSFLQSSMAAFTVLMDHVILAQPANTPLVFNRVITNLGIAYNSHTGKFTAPQDGVYLFSYSMHVNRIGQSFLQLVRNGVQIVGSVTESTNDYGDTQGGSTAVIDLFAGDQVWVEVFYDENDRLEGKYGGTSFTGALLA